MNATDGDIYTLHRYFIWANRLQDDFKSVVQDQGRPPRKGPANAMWLVRPFTYFSLWMAMLYVVCEGWIELGLNDAHVTTLLDPERIKLLKRYRNGVFHFQKEYFDQRYADFLTQSDNLVKWADDLHSAFGKYFLEWYRKTGVDVTVTEDKRGIKIQIKDKRRTSGCRVPATRCRVP